MFKSDKDIKNKATVVKEIIDLAQDESDLEFIKGIIDLTMREKRKKRKRKQKQGKVKKLRS